MRYVSTQNTFQCFYFLAHFTGYWCMGNMITVNNAFCFIQLLSFETNNEATNQNMHTLIHV